jgi:excisionase family DNA binding protein
MNNSSKAVNHNSASATASYGIQADDVAAGGRTTPSEIVPELVDSREAAQLLGIGKRTLWRWSRSGICPSPIKIGRGPRAAVRFRRADLMEWIAERCPRTDGKGGGK